MGIKPANEFKKYMLMLEELSTNRNLNKLIKEAEMSLTEIKWEDLPSYDLGLEVGEKRGEKKGQVKSAAILVKEFNLDPVKVAKKLDIDLDELLKELNG